MSDNEAEYELTLSDYIDIARQRLWLMVGIFIVISVSALAIAILLPPVYQSSGTILIESQQISTKIVESSVTGFATERVEVIKQRVMTRENLLRIINKYNLFPSKDKSKATSGLIRSLRKRITIEMLNASQSGRRRGKAAIAFNLAFEDRHAESAYNVTNELVTLFLNENIRSRVERATETTRFLSQESNRLKANLEKMEGLVASYKQKNSSALPENLNLKTSILQRTESALANLDRDYISTSNELQRLELELAAEKSGSSVSDTPASQLRKLKAEYQQASINYKATHPTLRSLKRKIEMLESSALIKTDTPYSANDNTLIDSELALKLQTLIKTAKERLISLDAERKPMRKRIEKYERDIIRTPQVELGLYSLRRDHASAKKKYEEIQAKQLSAQIAENLEGENKSERFTLIDPPLLADKPIKPNRIKVVLLGIIFAFAAAGGIAFLLEMLNKKIRGKGALAAELGEEIMVEIPYIVTNDEKIKQKTLMIRGGVGLLALLIISLIIMHFAYMELDLLFYKIINRLG